MKKLFLYPMLTLISLGLSGCSGFGGYNTMSKVRFDLEQLDQHGLTGDKDGLRSLTYEFCFPGEIEHVQELMSIDPSMVVYNEFPGRIQCTKNEYLGVGDTNQVGYREVLRKIVELDYVEAIHEAHLE